MPPYNNSPLPPYPPLPTEARVCHICSSHPHFSDVSRLLTHLNSKLHLKVHSSLEKASVDGLRDSPALVNLKIFKDWWEEYNVHDLMAIRLERKTKKAQIDAVRDVRKCAMPHGPKIDTCSSTAVAPGHAAAADTVTTGSSKGTSRFRSYMDPQLALPLPRDITVSQSTVDSGCTPEEHSNRAGSRCPILPTPGTWNGAHDYPTPAPSPLSAKLPTPQKESGEPQCVVAHGNQSPSSSRKNEAQGPAMQSLRQRIHRSPSYLGLKGEVLTGMSGWRLPIGQQRRTIAQMEALENEAKATSALVRMEEAVFAIHGVKGLCPIVVRGISEDAEILDDEGTGLKKVDIELPELGVETDQKVDESMSQSEHSTPNLEDQEIEMELLQEISWDDAQESEGLPRREEEIIELDNPGLANAPFLPGAHNVRTWRSISSTC